METEMFEGKMALLAKKHGLRLEWQPVRFGHWRAPSSPATATRR